MKYQKVDKKVVSCKNCSKDFLTGGNTKIFCSAACRSDYFAKSIVEKRDESIHESVSTGTIGAAHELVVCVDLMRKGKHVFRSQSPACPCDLIFIDGCSIFRVEVRTARRKDDGRLLYPPVKPEENRFDILAVVTYDGHIIYHDKTLSVIQV